MPDEISNIQNNDELMAIMDLSMKAKQENILLYGVQIIYSEVSRILNYT